MPLPPALAARLAKRGILKTPVVDNGQSCPETATKTSCLPSIQDRGHTDWVLLFHDR